MRSQKADSAFIGSFKIPQVQLYAINQTVVRFNQIGDVLLSNPVEEVRVRYYSNSLLVFYLPAGIRYLHPGPYCIFNPDSKDMALLSAYLLSSYDINLSCPVFLFRDSFFSLAFEYAAHAFILRFFQYSLSFIFVFFQRLKSSSGVMICNNKRNLFFKSSIHDISQPAYADRRISVIKSFVPVARHQCMHVEIQIYIIYHIIKSYCSLTGCPKGKSALNLF